jgi:hypothetical protein
MEFLEKPALLAGARAEFVVRPLNERWHQWRSYGSAHAA